MVLFYTGLGELTRLGFEVDTTRFGELTRLSLEVDMVKF